MATLRNGSSVDQAMSNVDVVRSLYQAFMRGDIAAILSDMAEDVEWEYGITSTDVPWLQPRRGREEVRQFFDVLAGLEIRQFEPKTLLGEGDIVVALLDIRATVKSTGREFIEEDLVHIWHFREGKIVRYRHRVDTHQHLQAFRGLT